MSETRTYEFKRREIILTIILLIVGAAILFYMGIKIGQSLLCKSMPVSEEAIKLTDIYGPGDKCQEAKPEAKPEAKTEETCKVAHFETKKLPNDMRGKYTVQIDAYREKDDAETRALELYNAGYKLSYYNQVEVPEQGTWFRVGIGFFKLRSDADRFGELLKSKGETTNYIVRKVD